MEEPDGTETPVLRMRIGGHDARRLIYKGWVRLEHFKIGKYEGTYCVFARDQVGGFDFVLGAWFAQRSAGQPYLVALAVEGCHPLPRGRAPCISEEGGRGGAGLRSEVALLVWFASVALESACTRYHKVSRCSIMEYV